MGKHIDIIGKKFNKLTAINLVPAPDHIINKQCLYYEFKCECGNTKICIGSDVRHGHTKSCGCAFKDKILNIVGVKFGKLLPIKEFIQSKRKHYICNCDCGYEVQVSKRSLVSGDVVSCGCHKYDNMINKKFGKLSIIKRVKAPENKESKFYFLCLCDCGKEIAIIANQIRSGKRTSCGCGIKHTDADEPYLASARNAYKSCYNDGDISFEVFLHMSQQACEYCGEFKGNTTNVFKHRKTCTDFAKENSNSSFICDLNLFLSIIADI